MTDYFQLAREITVCNGDYLCNDGLIDGNVNCAEAPRKFFRRDAITLVASGVMK